MNSIIKFAKEHNVHVFNELPQGWTITEGATTAPSGTVWISNNKSHFGGKRRTALLATELNAMCIDCKKHENGTCKGATEKLWNNCVYKVKMED